MCARRARRATSADSMRTDDAWIVEVGVVEDDLDERAWVDLADVEQLSDEIPVTVERLGLLRAAVHLGVTFYSATNRELGVDLDPDPKVPVRIDLRSVREHAVDDEHAVRGHRRLHRRVIDLGDRIDAAQRDAAVGGGVRRVEEQSAGGFTIERVAVVALAGEPVVKVSLAPRSLEVVERRSE